MQSVVIEIMDDKALEVLKELERMSAIKIHSEEKELDDWQKNIFQERLESYQRSPQSVKSIEQVLAELSISSLHLNESVTEL